MKVVAYSIDMEECCYWTAGNYTDRNTRMGIAFRAQATQKNGHVFAMFRESDFPEAGHLDDEADAYEVEFPENPEDDVPDRFMDAYLVHATDGIVRRIVYKTNDEDGRKAIREMSRMAMSSPQPYAVVSVPKDSSLANSTINIIKLWLLNEDSDDDTEMGG